MSKTTNKKHSKINSTNEIEPIDRLKKDIAERIRRARRARDYTVQYVADSIDISREALNQIERGKNHINAVTLYKLATRLDCPLTTFFPEIDGDFALGPKGRTLITEADPGSLAWIEDMFKKEKEK